MWGDCELIVLISWYFLKSLAQSLQTTTVRHIMKHCLGPWGLSRPIASGLFTAWQIFEFWTGGRTDPQKDSKFSSWRVDSKYISNKKIGSVVPEISSSKGKSHNSGSQAYPGLSVSRPEKSLILNFESSLFTYISMLKRFGYFLMFVMKIGRLSKG